MPIHIQRREFIVTLGGAFAWPVATHAQQAGKLPTIGFLGTDAMVWNSWTAAFVNGCVNWARSRVARSQSSIAGRRVVPSPTSMSRPSLSA
jgi:hypothetical protein